MALQRRLGILSQWLGLGSGDCAFGNSSSLATWATGIISINGRGGPMT